MTGCALVHGAVSIVNAISIGKGAALGIDLTTTAYVDIIDDRPEIQVEIDGSPSEDTGLAREAAKVVLRRYAEKGSGANVRIISDIPIGKGLKSSSAAANAVVLGTLCSLGKKASNEDIVKMGVDAAIQAGVTITGAYDDASASFYGGLVVTDNKDMKILSNTRINDDISIVLYVPDEEMYTRDFDAKKLEPFRFSVEQAMELAIQGEYWKAMTLNGIIHSSFLSLPTKPVVDAMTHGALGCGLSGTGPSIAAVAYPEDAKLISNLWSAMTGNVIITKVNNMEAKCI